MAKMKGKKKKRNDHEADKDIRENEQRHLYTYSAINGEKYIGKIYLTYYVMFVSF